MVGMLAAQGGLTALSMYQNYLQTNNQIDQINVQKELALRSSKGQARKFIGTQVADTGAAGVELSGSTLDLINQTQKEFSLDQEIIREQARLQKAAARQSMVSGFMSSLTGMAGNVAQYQQTSELAKIRQQGQIPTIGGKPTGYGGNMANKYFDENYPLFNRPVYIGWGR